jgi:hypothetical protein
MSNPEMPGMLKIGYTERPMDERLQEANASTWVPQPFSIEFAKHVNEPNAKEQTIHRILKEKRVNPKREFFRVSTEEVRLLFELMDGSWWDPEMEDEQPQLTGSQVVAMFLDKFIYPAKQGDPPATAAGVTIGFKTWKTQEGFKNGRVEDVIEKLRSQYSSPKPGVGWAEITMRVPMKTDE